MRLIVPHFRNVNHADGAIMEKIFGDMFTDAMEKDHTFANVLLTSMRFKEVIDEHSLKIQKCNINFGTWEDKKDTTLITYDLIQRTHHLWREQWRYF